MSICLTWSHHFITTYILYILNLPQTIKLSTAYSLTLGTLGALLGDGSDDEQFPLDDGSAVDASDDAMEHMEFFLDPMAEGEGVLGGVARQREDTPPPSRWSSRTRSQWVGTREGSEVI